MICDYEEVEFFDPETGRRGKVYRPILGIQLIKRGFKLFTIDSLLDSGADTIIFPLDLAFFFKMNYKKGIKSKFKLADGKTTTLYEIPYEKHKIDIFVNDIRIKERIYFSEGQKMPLLGQDFFKYFKITFHRAKGKFSLEKAL